MIHLCVPVTTWHKTCTVTTEVQLWLLSHVLHVLAYIVCNRLQRVIAHPSKSQQSEVQSKMEKGGWTLELTFRHSSHVWWPQGMLALEGRVAS